MLKEREEEQSSVSDIEIISKSESLNPIQMMPELYMECNYSKLINSVFYTV